MIKAIKNILKLIELGKQTEAKQKAEAENKAEYDKLVGSELNYRIIQDLFRQAQEGLRVEIRTKDGALLVFTSTKNRSEDHGPRPIQPREFM